MSRRILVNQLSEARDNFCGIGTRRAKLRLNRLAKGSTAARALRIALEIEDCSTQGKKYFGEWKDKCFARKQSHIEELIDLFTERHWTFGKQPSDISHPRWVIYFEVPGCEQISFHTDFRRDVSGVPDYPGVWDGERNSTLAKLERATLRLFDEERTLADSLFRN